MSDCPVNVDLISSDEYIGDSLTKINNNFATLLSGACDIEKRVDDRINIRTFFYYGPNSASDATSGMANNSASRPSDARIENFVNQSSQLNLPSISETGDIAYVIYQKTGWYKQQDNYYREGTGTVPFQRTVRVKVVRRIGICFTPGTLIATPNGDVVIESLQKGDLIYSFDPVTHEKKITKVAKTFKGHCKEAEGISPLYIFKHEKGTLEVTADHWVYTGDKNNLFKAAKEFNVGECLILENGEKSIIKEVIKRDEYDYVYNINVEKYHNFIANNVLTGDYQTDSYVTLNKGGTPSTETSVATPEGFKDISDVKVGDIVYGFDPETLELVEQKITHTKSKTASCIKVTHEYGTITLPEQQKIYFDKKYTQAKDLKVGDFLTVLEDTEVYTPYYDVESKILKIETNIQQNIVELETTDNHNYIFNNIFVHNGGGGGGTVTTWEPRVETYYVGYKWFANINDTYDYYAPIFIIYRLTCQGTGPGKQYVMDSGFPKYTRASTASTTNWNKPQLWSTY